MRTSVKYLVIYRHKEKYSISGMCRFFDVSRSGYYDYVKRMEQPDRDLPLAEQIRVCQSEVKQTYGYRRVQIWLDRQGIHRNPKTVLRVNKQDQVIEAEIRRSTEADAEMYSQLSLTTEHLTVTIGRIDNIHTGWRNLLRTSDTAYSNTSSPTAEYYLTDAPAEGEEVTLQIKGNFGEGADAFLVVNSGDTNPSTEIDLIELTSESYDETTGIYKATFNWTLTDGVDIADNQLIRIYSVEADPTRTAQIEWVKLERGNQASDWTPAPEDQVMKAEGILIVDDGFIRDRFHHPAGKSGIIKIFIQLIPELEIQGRSFRRGTVPPEQQVLHPMCSQNDPEHILQVQQDHTVHPLFFRFQLILC